MAGGCAAIALFVISEGAVAQPKIRDANVVGFDGGHAFRSDCGSRVLVGFNYRRGDALDGIEPVCAGFNAQGQRITDIVGSGRYFGGQGGDARSVLCPSEMIVQGAFLTTNPPFIASVELKCVNPKTGARAIAPMAGVFLGDEFYRLKTNNAAEFDCNANEVAIGVTGSSSSMINRLGLICKSDIAGIREGSGSNLGKIGNAGNAGSAPPAPEAKALTLDDRRWCRAYADRALIANKAVKDNSCRLSGGRHAATLSEHMVWCLGTTREIASSEERARDEEVRVCIAALPKFAPTPTIDAAKISRCLAYADAAEAANKQAGDYQCGLGADGGRHQATRQQHYAFCLNAPEAAVSAEAARRTSDLEACAACRSYSRTSVEQIAKSKSCSTPPMGALWMPESEEPHFQACFINRPGQLPFANPSVDLFVLQRESTLKACK
jgi:hypothetical protein